MFELFSHFKFIDNGAHKAFISQETNKIVYHLLLRNNFPISIFYKRCGKLILVTRWNHIAYYNAYYLKLNLFKICQSIPTM